MNEDGDVDDGAGRRHRLWMVLWTAVGALATAATAVIAFCQLNTSEEPPPTSGGSVESGKSSEKSGENSEDDDKYSALPGGKVLLKNTYTHFCADIPDTGEGNPADHVQQWQCNDRGDNQVWRLERYPHASGPKGRPVFQISNSDNGRCMDLPDFGEKPYGTLVGQHPCTEKATEDNQLWWLQKVKVGYRIRNLASGGLCLDVRGRIVEKHEVPLIIGRCTRNDQAWQMQDAT